jgi:hypothetical protein
MDQSKSVDLEQQHNRDKEKAIKRRISSTSRAPFSDTATTVRGTHKKGKAFELCILTTHSGWTSGLKRARHPVPVPIVIFWRGLKDRVG